MSHQKTIVLAVDGPAGSGKSSICKAVSQRLGWGYINTGAIYRALAVLARQQKIDLSDELALAELCHQFAEHLRWDWNEEKMIFKGEDITYLLSSNEAGPDASAVAKLGLIRKELLPIQRQMALAIEPGVLVDGRDIGTVVFPDAHIKIFITASLELRAMRRLEQLRSRGGAKLPSLDEVKTDIAKRDYQDQNRGYAPLKAAEEAKILDTSERSFEECVASVIEMIKDAGLAYAMPLL